MALDFLDIVAGDNPKHGVVWLHGLGADGHDFEPIVPELNLDKSVRFIFPHAPERPVTINGGMVMRAWYDVDPSAPLSGTDDINAASHELDELVAVLEKESIKSENIVLAGFSQGGVIALHNGLRSNSSFAGIMALSTYVHNHERLSEEISLANIQTPIFMAHGTIDPMIPITRAITSRVALSDLNYNVEWHQYGMGHQVCAEEIEDISRFLNRVFA